MVHLWQNSSKIFNRILIPKYYDPDINKALSNLRKSHDLFSMQSLVDQNIVTIGTGDEIGKSAYGTGEIPFVRTSDISNWEIKTIPKQGISREIYEEYSSKQDVRPGDILFVKDGTYLIGTNCFITEFDKEILFQSHILKLRIKENEKIPSELLFLSLNSPIVQRQVRSKQFTADIIDTIGNRLYEIIFPIPKNKDKKEILVTKAKQALAIRLKGKAFIKNAPQLLEDVIKENSTKAINKFMNLSEVDMLETTSSRTLTSEFGSFESLWIMSSDIRQSIFLPKYYDPSINTELQKLSKSCDIKTMAELRDAGVIKYYTGYEIGKMAYGTGEIPFIRTSDFANWEIKHNPKQGVSEEIYYQYKEKEDIQKDDILLVRDGTYLVGGSCIITEEDTKSLFCGGLYKIRVKDRRVLDPFLLLGLLNSYVVKRQIRTKQFTRDVIDTLGKRLDEVYIPIPKDRFVREKLSSWIQHIVDSRIQSRVIISKLAEEIEADGVWPIK